MSEVLIHAKNISFSYHQISDESDYILKNLSFDVRSGEMLGIMGPNGGGKSTLLSLIMGEHAVNEGQMALFDARPGEREVIAKISYLAQEDQGPGFFPLTVSDVLDFATFKNKRASEIKDQILKDLELVKIQKSLFRELSGGQKQKVLLAKAFLEDPQLLILDEPTKGLDAKGQDQLLGLIRRWSSESEDNKRCAIIVDHNISHLLSHCDRIMCLNRHAHWHDSKDKFSKDIMNDVYHCEYEHLLIHEHGGHSCS